MKTKYKITGRVSIRNLQSSDPMEIINTHEEIVTASTPEEAVELSLSGFKEGEDPTWKPGYSIIKIKEEDARLFEPFYQVTAPDESLLIDPIYNYSEENLTPSQTPLHCKNCPDQILVEISPNLFECPTCQFTDF